MADSFDASDPKAVELQKVAAGRRKQLDQNVIKSIMSTTEGRSWVWRLLQSCHIFTPSFDANSTHITAFSEGERNIGLRLLAMVVSQEEMYIQMMKESKENA